MSDQLPEGKWRIIAYRLDDGLVPVIEGSDPHLVVESGRVGGTGGVNRLMAGSIDLPLGPVAMTRMAGPPALMDQEGHISGLLSDANALVSGLSGMFLLRDSLPVMELVRDGTEPVETHVQ